MQNATASALQGDKFGRAASLPDLRLYRVLREADDFVFSPEYVTARELEFSDLAGLSAADLASALVELAALGCVIRDGEIVDASDYATAATQEAA